MPPKELQQKFEELQKEMQEKYDAMLLKNQELNLRIFGLEGKLNTAEIVGRVEGEARKELLTSIAAEQKEQSKRTRYLEIKIAGILGTILALDKFWGHLIK